MKEARVRRMYGSETEFGVSVPPGDVNKSLSEAQPSGISIRGKFLRNGAKSYLDVGNHPEYASPECETLHELRVHEVKGEELHTEAYVGKTPVREDIAKVLSLHKRSITPDGTATAGAHESYTTTLDIWNSPDKDKHIGVLGSHNATRTVYIGAGHPLGSEFNEDKYALAQKIQDIKELKGSQTTSNKPLVNTRDEPHNGGTTKLRRFHNTCGDASISPWVIKMKHGTTGVVLDLLENNIDMSDIVLENPVASAHMVAASKDNLTKPLRLANGKTASALNIQETIIERGKLLAERGEMPAELVTILEDDWPTVIDSLREYARTDNDVEYLHRLDWYTKRQILSGFAERKGGLSGKLFQEVTLLYDQTKNGIGVSLRRPGGRFSVDMPSPEELAAAGYTPPVGRATMRGEFVELFTQDPPPPGVNCSIDWGLISYNGRPIYLPADGDYSEMARKNKINEFLSRKQPNQECA